MSAPWEDDPRGGFLCCAGTLTGLAFFLSIVAVSWCEFAKFEFNSDRGGDQDVSFGMWRYQSFALIVDSGSNTIWKVDTCEVYPGSTPMDGYWKASQAFSIIAPVMGALLSLMMCCGSNKRWWWGKSMALMLLFVTMCQGLVFLFFKSNACDASKNPLFDVPDLLNGNGIMTQNDCDLARNGIVGILATCFWFVAALVPCAHPYIAARRASKEDAEMEDEDEHNDKLQGDEEEEAAQIMEGAESGVEVVHEAD